MASKNSSSVMLDVNAGAPRAQTEPLPLQTDSDDAFRILIAGDFSGGNRNGSRRPQRIDRDNFDEVLRAMNARATLKMGPTTVSLTFAALTDFEPDAIFERCDLFHRAGAPRPVAAPAASAAPMESDVAKLTSGSLLDEIVERSDRELAETENHKPIKHKDEMQSVIDRVVAPHLVQPEDRSEMDRSNSVLMRAILHHPQFQALEAAWRAVDLVARGLDTDNGLVLYLVDLSKAELASGLEDLLADGQPWALIAGNYAFDRSDADVALLEKIGALARRAAAPWIAESAPPDDESENSRWKELRESSDARWIGLALPRFLTRIPYGRKTYAIESFPFEEIEGRPKHTDYVWANPAFVCAWLLGLAFNEYGWKFRPGSIRQISGLPYFSFEADGQMESQPCAEVLLTDRQIEFIQDQGLMALAAMKNSDVAMLVRFQSIAEPVAGLAGRWGS